MTPIIETTCAWGKERTPGGWCMLESGGVGRLERLGSFGFVSLRHGYVTGWQVGQGWVDRKIDFEAAAKEKSKT
jgi:hypothetical protein